MGAGDVAGVLFLTRSGEREHAGTENHERKGGTGRKPGKAGGAGNARKGGSGHGLSLVLAI